jgi:glyoxylase-like metal-dependent hydrolase (beta-lactamase superfamily II)
MLPFGQFPAARIICHCLLIESTDGLILVDTGFGTVDAEDPRLKARVFRAWLRPRLDPAETALSQVRALGFDPSDVRHVVMTHLDGDHGGGLPDFPRAEVHVSRREHEVMLRPPRRERMRYAMGKPHRAHGPRWVLYDFAGDQWFGFESVRVIPDSDVEIVMIPLPGHSLGHTGIAVRQSERWLLHCGDAYFHRDELATPPSCPRGLRIFQKIPQSDEKLRLHNQERLRELARQHSDEVELFCAHDPVQLERLQAVQLERLQAGR